MLFGRKKSATEQVTEGRFELEQDGHVGWLKYSLHGNVLELNHTEIPPELRGKGLAAKLAQGALDYARENSLRVDVVCDSVAAYIKKHPEYADLVIK
ncbi:MAG TPA: GNAT family N-acetyltransferase [Terriglobales bacterium]|nr:GNAT family N-acetyltransferase [Terriglobales bacterium]